ncbi:hypothetical protein BJ508DRAFT_322203 [Ascobolus immersus RN42]|uniref:F-box domain-containing protein n=1 Tax=Ascobolus immersus RN42 TaxID=1160509 RepID=A0A3N4IWQ2_ASCIM|nr:hypothetical protein BJ508DRAFT_322203 [Ascobolus immersus RN42]
MSARSLLTLPLKMRLEIYDQCDIFKLFALSITSSQLYIEINGRKGPTRNFNCQIPHHYGAALEAGPDSEHAILGEAKPTDRAILSTSMIARNGPYEDEDRTSFNVLFAWAETDRVTNQKLLCCQGCGFIGPDHLDMLTDGVPSAPEERNCRACILAHAEQYVTAHMSGLITQQGQRLELFLYYLEVIRMNYEGAED